MSNDQFYKNKGFNDKKPNEHSADNTSSDKNNFVWKNEFRQEWIKDKINDKTITFANRFGEQLANKGKGLTTSQVRNFFGEIRRIQMNGFEKEYSSFLLLEPKLAYAVKRKTNTQGKAELKEFYDFFKECKKVMDINDVNKRTNQFNNLVQIMEAIIAYHKFHDGKE